MSTLPKFMSAEDISRLAARSERRTNEPVRQREGIEFSELVAELAKLPKESDTERAVRERLHADSVRAERIQRFRKACPSEFMMRINRDMLADASAFDRVAKWDGSFPGPLATGATGTAKSRAAWSALAHLFIEEKKNFAWFPVKRLITEFARYEAKDLADEFWRQYRGFNALFVDDLDKFNAQFESEGAALFQFYDWVYREHIPCITTTNKSRAWWGKLMGDAFVRRLFDDAHYEVRFETPKPAA